MSNYSIKLQPVYSCPAQASLGDVTLSQGWSLSWHQVETLKALRDPSVDFVFNMAMVGDGKRIAFGKSAFMLKTLTWRWKPKEDIV